MPPETPSKPHDTPDDTPGGFDARIEASEPGTGPELNHEAAQDTTLVDQAIGVRSRAAAAALDRLRAADRRLDAAQAAEIRTSSVGVYATELLSQGKRALMFGAAAAIVMLAAGIAWRIAQRSASLPSPVSAAEASRRPDAAEPALPPSLPGAVVPADRDDIEVSNYAIFAQAERTIRGASFLVLAGHHYPNERAPTFEHAWCFIQASVGGVRYLLDLGTLLPGGKPVAVEDARTAAALGFSTAEVGTLYAACPWLEAKPAAAARSYAFEGAVTPESMAALVAAVRSGAREVTLASPGGDLDAALAAFDTLHDAGIATRATGDCASACVLLLAAGQSRQVAADARIGVHQWATETDDPADAARPPSGAEIQQTSAEILARLTAAGISPELFIAASKTPAATLRILTPAEIIGWRLVT